MTAGYYSAADLARERELVGEAEFRRGFELGDTNGWLRAVNALRDHRTLCEARGENYYLTAAPEDLADWLASLKEEDT